MIDLGVIALQTFPSVASPFAAATWQVVLLGGIVLALMLALTRLTFVVLANVSLTRTLERRVAERTEALEATMRAGQERETALKESEVRFRMLADTASDVVFRVRLLPQPRFEYLSPSIEWVTGYRVEEVIANPELTWERIVEDLDDIEARIAVSPDESVVFRYLRKDGKRIWVEVRTAVQRNDDGHVAVLQGIARDITYRIEETAELARLAAIVDSSGEAIVGTDTTGNITVWNPAAERLFGYTREEILGSALDTLIPPHLADERDTVRARCFAGEVVGPFDTQRLHKDGTLIDVSVMLSPIRDERDAITGISASIGDITDRRATEHELRLSDERNRLILEQAQTAFVGTDQSGRIAEWNRQAETVFGWTADEAIGRRPGFLFPEHDRDLHETALRDLLVTGRGAGMQDPVQFTAVRRDGSFVRIEAHVSIVVVEDTRRVYAFLLDITDRARAERALRKSEETFRRLMQSAPDAAIIVDSRMRVMLVNTAAENMVGYSFERLLGEPIQTILPEGLPETAKFLEAEARHRDGHAIAVDIRTSPIETGDEQYTALFIRDIADRKAVEAALRRSEERFRSMVQSALDAAIIVDRAGRIVLANAEAERLYGYDPGDLIGRNLDVLVPERFRSHHTSRFMRMAESSNGRDSVYRRDLTARRKDGSEFPADAILSSFETEDGVFLTALIRDTTERTRTEELLRRSEERFRAIFEGGPLGIVVTTGDGTLVRANRAFTEMIGFSESDLLDRSLDDLLHPERLNDRAHRDRVMGGEISTYRIQQEYLRRDGEAIWADIVWSTLIEDEQVFLVGLVQDVTTQRDAEDALRRANDELRRANEAKSVFLARMSHELRTPLSAILISAEMLTTPAYGARTDEMLTQLGGRILQGGRHLLGLIDDLLDLTRIETGRLNISPVPMSAAGLIIELEGGLGPHARRKRVRLELPDGDDVTLLADPLRIRQVFLNLIGNAIKFTDAGGSVWVGVSQRRGTATFTVTDTGPGIAPEDIARIFEPFEQATPSAEGAGLGLAIAKQIVQMHGGTIEVESSLGTGTTFKVALPLASTAVPADGSDESPVPSAPRRDGRILLVEDDEDIAALMQNVLRTAGFEPAHAATAGAAVQTARAFRPDLVLLDIGLGTESGLAIVEALRDWPGGEHTPILALSAFAMPDEIRRAREAGCDDYLVKPISGRDIVACIDQWIAMRDAAPSRNSSAGDGQHESERDPPVTALGPHASAE